MLAHPLSHPICLYARKPRNAESMAGRTREDLPKIVHASPMNKLDAIVKMPDNDWNAPMDDAVLLAIFRDMFFIIPYPIPRHAAAAKGEKPATAISKEREKMA